MIDIEVDLKCNKIKALPKTLIVKNLQVGEVKTESGLIIPEENMHLNQRFIKPRWAQVYAKGDGLDNIEVGDWVLLHNGHWSTSMKLKIGNKSEKVWYIMEKNVKRGLIAVQKDMPDFLKNYIDISKNL